MVPIHKEKDMDKEQNHAYHDKTIGQIKDRREKGHPDVINHIFQANPVDQISDTARHNQNSRSTGEKGVVSVKQQAEKYHYDQHSGYHRQNPGIIPEHTEGRSGIFHIHEIQQAGNRRQDTVRAKILHHQKFNCLICRNTHGNQNQ